MAGSIQEAFRNVPPHEGHLKRAVHKNSKITIVATDRSSASVLEKSTSVFPYNPNEKQKSRRRNS